VIRTQPLSVLKIFLLYQAGKQAFGARQQSAQNNLNAKSKLSNLMSLGLWSFYKVSLLGVDSLLEIARLF